jgi:hypothetical protein
MPALYPELARLWVAGNTNALYRLVMQVALSGGALATVLLVVAAVGGRSALRVVLGDDFVGAAPVMTWARLTARSGNRHATWLLRLSLQGSCHPGEPLIPDAKWLFLHI